VCFVVIDYCMFLCVYHFGALQEFKIGSDLFDDVLGLWW
jgi:hypothetical protein